MKNVLIVVPCFNEAERFDSRQFLDFVDRFPDIGFILVDDGSTDATLEVLGQLAATSSDHFDVLPNDRNLGKGESVRRGVLYAQSLDPDYIGYWDADLATPLDEIPRFRDKLARSDSIQYVTGARVKMLGWSIHRNELRHYLGRIFATAVSATLRLGVYDTQCGAKLFRASSLMDDLFKEEFLSRWIFDVEILARLVAECRRSATGSPEDLVCEIPVRTWKDVPGSKVNISIAPRVLIDLCRIYRMYLTSRTGSTNKLWR